MKINSVHITTYQQSTWGRVYISYEQDNQLYYAFKNFITFTEHNYVGDGELNNEPAYSWFEQTKRFDFTFEDVLTGKADDLYLTPPKWKNLYGTPSILLKRLLIDIYSINLTPVEHRRGWFKQYYKPSLHISKLYITKGYNQLVLEDYQLEVVLEPLMKTLFILFLKHPEGVTRSNIGDYETELSEIYTEITNKSDLSKVQKSIQSLIDISGKSFDEKISKIKKLLIDLLGDKLAHHYYISKSETEDYKIKLDQNKILFD